MMDEETDQDMPLNHATQVMSLWLKTCPRHPYTESWGWHEEARALYLDVSVSSRVSQAITISATAEWETMWVGRY